MGKRTPQRHRKVFRVLAPGDLTAFDAALSQAQHWLKQAGRFDRQRHHLAFAPSIEEVPPDSIRVAQQLFDCPSVVKTDVQLDRELEVLQRISKILQFRC